MKFSFSWLRLKAIIIKEFNQIKRDYTTFAIIIAIPIIQLILFGYAINVDPKHLPLAILSHDYSDFTRTYIKGLENTEYFSVVHLPQTESEAEYLIAAGKAQFILNIPSDFSRKLVRGESPTVLLEADASDSAAIRSALLAVNELSQSIFTSQLKGKLSYLAHTPPRVQFVTHVRYNPNNITQYTIVPGLLGVILTMTLVMVTAMAITREREQSTMESLLATPARPLEVIIGKSIPYIIVGYLQSFLIISIAYFLFHIPITGSLLLLLVLTFPFIFANLLVGICFSTLADTQLQASQMSAFFFLPSILLSGFAFPFRGMPDWAQWIGNILPLTHYVNITRGILLKGNGFVEVLDEIGPILLFMAVVMVVAVTRYRGTLD